MARLIVPGAKKDDPVPAASRTAAAWRSPAVALGAGKATMGV